MPPHQAGFQALHVQVPTPKATELTVFGDRTFKEVIQVNGGLVKRGNLDSQRNISCLQRKDRGEDTVRRPPSVHQEKGLLRNQPCGHLDLALPVSGTVRNKGLLLKSLRW